MAESPFQDGDHSDDSDEDFGQRLPPLHVYIKRVLDKYPEGGQILKELLQNADDAGAKEVIFLYDKSEHPTQHLWSPSLSNFNGPALYVYNDATFNKADWYNIQHPEQSGKHDDPMKVGRYGLGFISVYHLTDLPSIFSGSHIGFLDPHEKYFTVDPNTGAREKGKRGLKKRISTQLLNSNLKDQFSPFLHPLFGCSERDFMNGSYPGTIFRFPLRRQGMESKISRVQYDDTRVREIFQSFQNDAEMALLFLKSVESVSIYEKDDVDERARMIFKCEISKECSAKLRLERFNFVQQCLQKSNQVISCSDVKIATQGKSNYTEINRYIIINLLKTKGLSGILQSLLCDTDLNLLPWVGLAAKVNASRSIEGRTFCFLPLPESERSNLPVHVHGYFGLGDNRRSIKWPDRESQHDKAALWNKNLIEEVLPEAYTRVILEAIRARLSPQKVYNQWPNIKSLTGAWRVAARNLVYKLSQQAILYTEVRGGVWLAPENVYINTTSDELIQRVMLKHGTKYPVVTAPSKVLEALKSGGVELKQVTPTLIRQVIRGDVLQWLNRREKLHLLDYVLCDGNFTDLEGIYLLPVKDESFKPFAKEVVTLEDAVFINNPDIPSDLFPYMESMFCSDDCPRVIHTYEVSVHTQIRSLATANVVQLLKASLPNDWVNGKGMVMWTPGSEQQPQKEWLRQLWAWLRRGMIPLKDLSSLPLIQVNESGNAITMARLQARTLIFQMNLSNNICKFLQSIGAIVVQKRLVPDYINKHPDIGAFIHNGNAEGFMHILEAHWSDDTDRIAQVQGALRDDLANLLSEIPRSSLTLSWKTLLRKIPIFKCTDGKHVASNVCRIGVHCGFYGFPVRRTKGRLIVVEEDLVRLAKDIGVSFISETELLVKYILPEISNNFYTEDEKVKLVEWVLEQPKFDGYIKDIPFILTSSGSYSSPSMLYDPGNELLRSLFGDLSVIPIQPYDKERILFHLRRVGFKDESNVSAQQLFEISCEISSTTSRTRSSSLLIYICRYVDKLNRHISYRYEQFTLGAILKRVHWVACESEAPSWYPDAVHWYGKSGKLFVPSEVRCLEQAHLIGSVAPLADAFNFPHEIRTLFNWNPNSIIDIEQIAKHLQNIIGAKNCDEDQVSRLVISIYRYLEALPLPRLMSFSKMLEKEEWIWHGNGFTSQENVAFSSVIPLGNLAPYLFLVPERKEVKSLLGKIGVRRAFRPSDYAKVLTKVKQTYNGKPLTERDMQAVQDVIKAITLFDDALIEDVRRHIYAPDQSRVLRHCTQLTYNPRQWARLSTVRTSHMWEGSSVDLVYAHHCITGLQAKKLRIKTLTDIRLDQCSTDGGFAIEFGQREKITTRLRGILAESPNESDVLKELLQNADDAGATHIHIVYDPREHKGKNISGSSWRPIHRLPALCVYNDKPFTDKDIEGIQNVGVGGKESDRTTIGRFGIGFNVAYHLTDCPTFLTQNKSKLCVFDPHTTYVPLATVSAPGKLYHVQDPRFADSFSDMTEGYLQEFDEFDLSRGTMFRFPLRSQGMKSELSDKCYSAEKVNNLLSKFEDVSQGVLLFLNNIKKLTISEIDQNTGALKVRYSVEVRISPKGVKCRQELGRYLETNKNTAASQIRQMNRTYTMEMIVNRKQETWLVSQVVGVDGGFQGCSADYELASFMSKAYLPRGGAAVPLNRQIRDGKVFCFLPLQTESTGLPVYVNGTFLLDQSRQNLMKGSQGLIHPWNKIMKGSQGLIHPWNKMLVEQVIGPAYSQLINAAGRLILKSIEDFDQIDGQFTCRSYDRLFPVNLYGIRGIWKLLAISALRFINHNSLEVMPVVMLKHSTKEIVVKRYSLGAATSKVSTQGGSTHELEVQWHSPDADTSHAYFDDLTKLDSIHANIRFGYGEDKQSKVVRNFLRRVGFKLISCSAEICKIFTSREVGTRAALVSPKHCMDYIRLETDIADALPCHVARTVFKSSATLKVMLEYCLKGLSHWDDLNGFPLLLDENGTLHVFSQMFPKYLSYHYSLLPNCQHLFIHNTIYITLIRASTENENLSHSIYNCRFFKHFSIFEFAKYINTHLPTEWYKPESHVLWQPEQVDHPSASWLTSLWNFIILSCVEESTFDNLAALADWPIIPTESGHLVSVNQSKTVLFLDPLDHQRHVVTSALRKLGCPIVKIDSITGPHFKLTHNLRKLLNKYLSVPTIHRDILTVTQHMINQEKAILTGKLNGIECETLLRYFQEAVCLRPPDKQHIKQLPLFPLSTSTQRASIYGFSHCHTLGELDMDLAEFILDWVMRNMSCVFIKHNLRFVCLYEELGITPITLPGIFLKYVLPNHVQIPRDSLLGIIEFVRDSVLHRCPSEYDKDRVYELLRTIPFIPDTDGELHKADYYYDSTNEVFKVFRLGNRCLPLDFNTVPWQDLLRRIGLNCDVTGDLFITYARTIEEMAEMAPTILPYLTKIAWVLLRELQRDEILYDAETLRNISTINFVPSVIVDDIRQSIHPQHASTNFTCFKGGVSEELIDFVWTVSYLIPSEAIPKTKTHSSYTKTRIGVVLQEVDIHAGLGIETTLVLSKVIQHIRNICCSAVKHNAYDVEDAMEKQVRLKLVGVLSRMIVCMNNSLNGNEVAIKNGLQDIPICAVGDKDILVRANQLVFKIDEGLEDLLRPYLYRAPRELALSDKVLRVLGAQERPTFDQLAMCLKAIKQNCKDKTMLANEKKSAYAAVKCIFRLLLSTKGTLGLGVTVRELYLPTLEGKLVRSTRLFYTDLDDVEFSELPSSNADLVIPVKPLLGNDIYSYSEVPTKESELMKLLPNYLRPSEKRTHERPLESNLPCIEGDKCRVVRQVKNILQSEDTHECLLRLIKHQTERPANTTQRTNIDRLVSFDNLLCVQELKTGFFDDKGDFLGERKLTTEVFLDSSLNVFQLHIAHVDISEDAETGSRFFLPLAKSIDYISKLNLDKEHILYLKDLLPPSSMRSKHDILQRFGIHVGDDRLEESPGMMVPKGLTYHLDEGMSNKFYRGDIAVYLQNDGATNVASYVYVKVLDRIPLTTDESGSFRCYYSIDYGQGEPIVVSAVKLYTFRRTREDDEMSYVSFIDDSSATESELDPISLQAQEKVKIQRQIRKDVKDAMLLPEIERKECVRRFYRRWHPDKNPAQKSLATEAFQYLKQQLDKGTSHSTRHNMQQWESDIEEELYDRRTYKDPFRYCTQSTSRSGERRFNLSDDFSPRVSHIRRPDPSKARLWYRQSLEDFRTAQEHDRKNIETSRAWCAFMIHQAVEKSLKAAMFFFEGSHSLSHDLNSLTSDVLYNVSNGHQEMDLRDLVRQIIRLGCDAMRPRYPEDGSNRTTGETYKDFQASAALGICESILDFIAGIIGTR